MDAPLLALTLRRRANAPNGLAPETAAAENMRQLSQLRWIAVAGQTLTILFVHFVLGVALPLFQMLSVVLVLGAANFAARAALPHYRVQDVEVLAALLLDMGALTLQLYYSGGATNPFISLYLLQVVLGAILLPRRSVWVLVAATCFCYALLSVRYVPLVLAADAAGRQCGPLHDRQLDRLRDGRHLAGALRHPDQPQSERARRLSCRAPATGRGGGRDHPHGSVRFRRGA